MDTYEATRVVLTRIQNLDPENASKIMGVLLIQDHGEKEMIRLAFGPESLLQSVVLKARQELGLCSSPSTHSPRTLPWSVSSNPPFFNNNGGDLIDELALYEFGNGSSYGSDESTCGFGWKPCLYYARGYCKNGSGCRFLHGGDDVAGDVAAEVARAKQRMAAGFGYSGSGLGGSKGLSLLLQQQQTDSQRAAAALMMGDLGALSPGSRPRLERNDFSMSPGSRQIYLTFPADSTFREEDVSNYFSIFGPVQDVRIPYQQKRMFGFVTFVYSDTVKIILAKGNPHFVCDARVLVKPYKEKGKIPDKFRKQQLERGDFSCGSPTGLDSRADPFDPLGRMYGNGNSPAQEILWRRKLEEQAELQQAIEIQGRRLMSLQLLDVKRHHFHHNRSLSNGSPVPSPTHSPSFFNQTLVLPSDRSSPDSVIENGFHLSNPIMPVSAAVLTEIESKEIEKEKEKEKDRDLSPSANGTVKINGSGKDSPTHHQETEFLPESLDHNLNLPDSPFASPKAAGDFITAFNSTIDAENAISALSSGSSSANNSLITSALLPASSTLDMASYNSCYFPVPRFSSGHGAIEM